MDGAGGEVVSVLAFNSDVSISNPVDVYIFYFTKLHEKKPEITLKFASGQVNRHTWRRQFLKSTTNGGEVTIFFNLTSGF